MKCENISDICSAHAHNNNKEQIAITSFSSQSSVEHATHLSMLIPHYPHGQRRWTIEGLTERGCPYIQGFDYTLDVSIMAMFSNTV